MTSASEKAVELLNDVVPGPWLDEGGIISAPQSLDEGNVICQAPAPECRASVEHWPINKRFIVACRLLVPELLAELDEWKNRWQSENRRADRLDGELLTCRDALGKTRVEADKAITDATFARAELKQAHAQILKLAMDLDELRKVPS
jgi:hypothetical protein